MTLEGERSRSRVTTLHLDKGHVSRRRETLRRVVVTTPGRGVARERIHHEVVDEVTVRRCRKGARPREGSC
ncbi:hypothetical protein BDA96_01G106000 [Sorghum bicolor]|jgi:hypothetical protein|uniref:Uncharacterized protein n=2 Tax=Sorghum bicolor TaxID=4558 RepID=A0A921UX73_SORBI|nr:hypothetical protein BDA96_01G106000 [Sorghum bicolor]KXG37636.1 hypothetical protein SORBI_3001G102000 [Sorghum bicolor]